MATKKAPLIMMIKDYFQFIALPISTTWYYPIDRMNPGKSTQQ